MLCISVVVNNTVKVLKIPTPKQIAVIILKFEQFGLHIELGIQNMQTEWQTV